MFTVSDKESFAVHAVDSSMCSESLVDWTEARPDLKAEVYCDREGNKTQNTPSETEPSTPSLQRKAPELELHQTLQACIQLQS